MLTRLLLIAWLGCLALAGGAGEVRLSELHAEAEAAAGSFRFTLRFTAVADTADASCMLLPGDVLLREPPKGDGWRLEYDRAGERYLLVVSRTGVPVTGEIQAAMATQSSGTGSIWRHVVIALPEARLRHVAIATPLDAEARMAGVVGVTEARTATARTVSGLLPPGLPWTLAWESQAAPADIQLLASVNANTLVLIQLGAMRVDTLLAYTVAQGELKELSCKVPAGLTITQVSGRDILDWRVEGDAEARRLRVALRAPQNADYALQVVGEQSLGALPLTVAVPVIQPEGVTRASGQVGIGTSSAIQVQVEEITGLSQIDVSAFQRVVLREDEARPLPGRQAYYYAYAAASYQARVALDDIVPTIDVVQQLVVQAGTDDLAIDAQLQVEVRDAPIRRLEVVIPEGFLVASVTGQPIADYAVAPSTAAAPRTLGIEFGEQVLGAHLVALRLELGRSPVGSTHLLQALDVVGARTQRGAIAAAAEAGVLIDSPEALGLRPVHARSIEMRVADAQFAWRFNEPGWSLRLPVSERPAAIRAETFHLASIGNNVVYGAVAVSYHITGAPVDELAFAVTPGLDNLEFVGLEVSRWEERDGLYRVRLRRKVLGDYNLGVTFTQRYEDGGQIAVGGIDPALVETGSGYVVVASHLDVKLAEAELSPALIPIGQEELPSQYRLVVAAPVLRSYKYVQSPHLATLTLTAYDRGATPTALVEFVNAKTRLSVTPGGQAESMTTVRYAIKNSSAQFLDLRLPAGLEAWDTRLVQPEGEAAAERLAASRDGDLLKIPLPRRHNPNQPLFVEVDFGQTHGELGWGGAMQLVLPPSPVQMSYAAWEVTAPDRWAVTGGEGSMAPTDDVRLPLARALIEVGQRWAGGQRYLILLGVLLVAGLVALIGRCWPVTHVAVVAALLVATLYGAWAWMNDGGDAPAAASASFAQVLQLDAGAPMTIAAKLMPAWRQDLSLSWLAVCAAVVILGWSLRQRWRPLGWGLLIAGLAGAVAMFGPGQALLIHLGTWGLPLILLIAYARRLVRRPAVALLAALLLVGNAAQAAPEGLPPLNRLDVTVRHDANGTAEVELHVTSDAKTAFQAPVAGPRTVVTEAPDELLTLDDGFVLAIPRGPYEATVKLLLPSPVGDKDQTARLALPLPTALTTQVNVELVSMAWTVDVHDALILSEPTAEAPVLNALLRPGQPLQIAWQPRSRRKAIDQPTFHTETTTVVRVGSGLAVGYTGVRCRIAQGELDRLRIAVPPPLSVSGLRGADVASWRFDPEAHVLEVQLGKAYTEVYELLVGIQVPAEAMPYEVTVGPLLVEGSARQRGAIGLVAANDVVATVTASPREMNVQDFVRSADLAMRPWGDFSLGVITRAFRQEIPADVLAVRVEAVVPEVRSTENAALSVADDRIVYNAQWQVEIAKAGLFAIDLNVPADYDLESLTGDAVSHWEEREVAGQRQIRVHFQAKRLGREPLFVALSRTITSLPPVVEVPRVSVVDAVKHSGQLAVSVDRGVRLSVREREGVSELDVAQMVGSQKPSLAFKLLRPDWRIVLATEVLTPRINVDFLHLAQVSDGLVRHAHHLRFELQNAGARQFEVRVPEEALGLQLIGPAIARKEPVPGQPGVWRIELGGRWFDRPYPLQVTYETRFEPAEGALAIAPVVPLGVDLVRGYVVVKASGRIELSLRETGAGLQAAEARTVPTGFGVGDLADAAFCYTTTGAEYGLQLQARRHVEAGLLTAEVQHCQLTSVVSRQGDVLHQVRLTVRASGKRHLQAFLPPGTTIWSLLVDRQAWPPTYAAAATGGQALLIPLPPASAGPVMAEVELVFVQPAASRPAPGTYEGPRFDVPLRDIVWAMYLPEDFTYYGFDGTLRPDPQYTALPVTRDYDLSAYAASTRELNEADLKKAVTFQDEGIRLAQEGQQQAARQALQQAYNYSVNDRAINEDARVALRSLMKQQAMVGLIGRRDNVRQADQPAEQAAEPAFTQEQAERLQASLAKADSENLELITSRLIATQEAAADLAVQLMVSPPTHGRMLVFRRALQVEPGAEMRVEFSRWQHPRQGWLARSAWLLGLALVLALIAGIAPLLRRGCQAYHRRPAPSPAPELTPVDEHPETTTEPKETTNE